MFLLLSIKFQIIRINIGNKNPAKENMVVNFKNDIIAYLQIVALGYSSRLSEELSRVYLFLQP